MSEVLLSQLAHVELVSPKPEETVSWMVEVLGLEETERAGQSVYLRGWAEWPHSSMIVTEGPSPHVAHIGWRAYGPDDPELVAQRLAGSGVEEGWAESSVGHGKAFRYRAPVGRHLHEVFWETELYQAPPDRAEPDFQNRPQRFSARGAAARYIDHVTIATPSIDKDIEFYRSLGHRHTAQIQPEPGFTVFATMTCNGIRPTHDLGLVPDFSGATGRANHIAFRVDQRLDVERAAEVFMAAETPIEFGPGIHGLDEITYLYVREPGGFRIEINSGGWVNSMPDWQPKTWNPAQGGTTFWKNIAMPESMMESWPAVDGRPAAEAKEEFQSTQMFVNG
ncbi:MAG: VOC family protein [Solirubrobacterales bacterium]|nr:VOC family protein [Solirubrobacterales bacterium]MBV9047874.1 VOC family protein [Solirubrobacterales bacterium]